ncbi:unnamed protein product [Brassicogethes aeneus]|uniref:Cytochrome P450 n=1 Tax=Brassicogethes aeneus TaxID=1431903 RepID=A0A9P0BAD1_BRAAE|nr:unnamed protein product [Brassicogethes aeneus]
MFFGILVAILSAVLVVYVYFKVFLYTYWDNFNVETIEPTFPFGSIFKIFTGHFSLSGCVREFYEKCNGKFAGIYFVTSPAIFIKDPELVKLILVKDFNSFTDTGLYLDEKKEPTSGHLFRLKGERWRTIRNKLTPAFTVGKLKGMFTTITDVADQLKIHLSEECDGQNIDVSDLTTRYSADIIASTIFGLENNSFKDKNNDFILMAKDLFVSESFLRICKGALQVFFPTILSYFHPETVKNAQDKFIYHMVKNVIEYREKNKVTRADLMQLLMQLKNKGKISDEDKENDLSVFDEKTNNEVTLSLNEIAAQAYTFFFAGYETTSTTLSLLLYECAINQHLQKNIQKNIDEVLDKYNGAITYESVSEMEYLDRAISETLRKYPPLSFLARVATKDYVIPDTKVTIKKDMRVLICVDGLQNDPKYFPVPNKFDPDRFLPSEVSKRPQFSYLPFSEGPRTCIGKRIGKIKIAVGMAMMLRNFNFDICKNTEFPIKFNKMSFLIQAQKPIVLNITKRVEEKE